MVKKIDGENYFNNRMGNEMDEKKLVSDSYISS